MKEIRTEKLPNHKAGIIQNNCVEYNCEILETGIVGRDLVRITVQGEKEDLDALFELVKDPGVEPPIN